MSAKTQPRERVLFVRVDERLVRALDRQVAAEVKVGANKSRSEVVRILLWEALRGRNQRDRAVVEEG